MVAGIVAAVLAALGLAVGSVMCYQRRLSMRDVARRHKINPTRVQSIGLDFGNTPRGAILRSSRPAYQGTKTRSATPSRSRGVPRGGVQMARISTRPVLHGEVSRV